METKVLTPKGFKLLGDVNVGDQVTNPDGTVATVIATHFPKNQQFYRVTFSDGASVEVGHDHLWGVRNASVRKRRKVAVGPVPENMSPTDEWNFRYFQRYSVVTTTQLLEMFNEGDALAVPLTSPCVLTCVPGRWPTLPPYTVGVLIGDGSISHDTVSWSKPDEYIVDKIAAELDPIDLLVTSKEDSIRHGIVRRHKSLKESAQVMLQRVGLMGTHSWDRFIPQRYKVATIEDRYALINGLMDTDGYVDERGHVEYSTASKVLAEDVQWVLRSLGYTATIHIKEEPKIGNVVYRPSYRIYVRGNNMKRLFTLPRKHERLKDRTGVGSGSTGDLWADNRIVSIEPTVVEDGKCIAVDNPNRLYITDDFIVTHNTYAVLLQPIKHLNNPGFGGVVLRRDSEQIRKEGGLWDTSSIIYPQVRGKPKETTLEWSFPSGASITFAAIQYDADVLKWQGTQICYLAFDEATHFTSKQFWYMLSRNRSVCGVKPYVRLTFNPDPDSWVYELFGPWVDPLHPNYGAKPNEVLHFMRSKGVIQWVPEGTPKSKSITFIPAKIHDNKILMEGDPDYLANLEALDETDRLRLLEGMWAAAAKEGALWEIADHTWEGFKLPPCLFRNADGQKVFKPPADMVRISIGIDPTFADPDARKNPEKTLDKCGIIVSGVDTQGQVYVLFDGTCQSKAESFIKMAAELYKIFEADVIIVEAYGGGEVVKQMFDVMYPGGKYNVQLSPFKRGDKAARAKPTSMLYKVGRIHHCGELRALEHQQLNWDPRVNGKSPNNIDALVWSIDGLNLGNLFELESHNRITLNLGDNETNGENDDNNDDEYFAALSELAEAEPQRKTAFGYVGDDSVSMLRIKNG